MSWKVFHFFSKMLRLRGDMVLVIHHPDGTTERHSVEFPQ
jgi:hypothetical protein